MYLSLYIIFGSKKFLAMYFEVGMANQDKAINKEDGFYRKKPPARRWL